MAWARTSRGKISLTVRYAALAPAEEPAEESPLGRAEPVPRQQHPALRVDPEAGDADEEALVRGGHEPPLPAHGERVEHEREDAHQHRRTVPPP